jgi:hypothetical protein
MQRGPSRKPGEDFWNPSEPVTSSPVKHSCCIASPVSGVVTGVSPALRNRVLISTASVAVAHPTSKEETVDEVFSASFLRSADLHYTLIVETQPRINFIRELGQCLTVFGP